MSTLSKLRSRFDGRWCTLVVALHLLAAQVSAQRVDENAVTSANDAFGRSIGRETTGLYSASRIRGFSPVVAGNVRVDGLYFDQVWGYSPRLRESTSIRVGPSALGFPFPAPTGIVDYKLRRPGRVHSSSVMLGGDSYDNAYLELDTAIPLTTDTLSLGLGLSALKTGQANGTAGEYLQGSGMLRWTPRDGAELLVFGMQSHAFGTDSAPFLVPGGDFLPPKVERRRFNGPDWARYKGVAENYGAIGTLQLEGDLRMRAGLFRSLFDDQRSFTNLLTDLQPDGSARRVIVADPPTSKESISGELLVSKALPEGPRIHLLHASLRARDRRDRYEGADRIDFGASNVSERFTEPRPDFHFRDRIKDDIQQVSLGLAYEGRWEEIGELSMGLARTSYRKDILLPELGLVQDRQSPWLYNLNLAYQLTSQLVVYGGHTRGLEESGVAPGFAANRNEALPAILTQQWDAGVRYDVGNGLSAVLGVFDVRKPYFNLDEQDRFGLLGDVRHRGIESSLSGKLLPDLNVVLGYIWQQPRVTGEGVALDRVGVRPVGPARHNARISLDWMLPGQSAWSLDVSAAYLSAQMATVNNAVSLPSQTLVDLGARYRFAMQSNRAMLRLTLTNIFDTYIFELRGRGSYDVGAGRVMGAYLTVDL
jgi:iron complex outermembrane receptor protein